MNTSAKQLASMTILYTEYPKIIGDKFIEIRRWETPNKENVELVIEYGQLDDTGELKTVCQVMPFHLSVRQVLAGIDQ